MQQKTVAEVVAMRGGGIAGKVASPGRN